MRKVQTCHCHRLQQPMLLPHLRLMQQPVKQPLRQRRMPPRLQPRHLLQSNQINSV